MGDEPRGQVRMTAPLGSEILPGILAAFTRLYPRVHVSVVFTGRFVDLVEEGFDLALRAGRLADSTLVARKIADEELALYASPAYVRRRGRPRRLADLAEHDCVLQRAVNGRGTYHLRGPDGEEQIEVSGRVSADEMLFLYQAAEAGSGIALLPESLVRPRLARKSLVRVLPGYAAVGNGLFVVVPSSRFLPARVARLRDFLVEGFRGALGGPSSS
jgi:DNA-binding transcriptional LysR family regulator